MSQLTLSEISCHRACANSQQSFAIRTRLSLDSLTHLWLIRWPFMTRFWLTSFYADWDMFRSSLETSFAAREEVLALSQIQREKPCLEPFFTVWERLLFTLCWEWFCSGRDHDLNVLELSSVIMMFDDLVCFEDSELCLDNVSHWHWICWKKIDLVIVRIGLHCKLWFWIWFRWFPESALDIAIYENRLFDLRSSHDFCSISVYRACIIVKSAIHILLLVNPQMQRNIFLKSFHCCFLHWIWSSSRSRGINPFHSPRSCRLFCDISSEVFRELESDQCRDYVHEIKWSFCESCFIYDLEWIELSLDERHEVWNLCSSVLKNEIISSRNLWRKISRIDGLDFCHRSLYEWKNIWSQHSHVFRNDFCLVSFLEISDLLRYIIENSIKNRSETNIIWVVTYSEIVFHWFQRNEIWHIVLNQLWRYFDRIVSKTDLTESLLERVSPTVLSIYHEESMSRL